jgi:hypothetical protein
MSNFEIAKAETKNRRSMHDYEPIISNVTGLIIRSLNTYVEKGKHFNLLNSPT